MKKRKSWGTIGVPKETWERIKALAERQSVAQWEVIESFLHVKRKKARGFSKPLKLPKDN